LCNISGVVVGSTLLGKSPEFKDYQLLFTISTCVRLVPLFIVFMIDWKPYTKARKFFIRSLGVRPHRGGISRPILYIDDSDDDSKDDR
jgi:hypothetical protein